MDVKEDASEKDADSPSITMEDFRLWRDPVPLKVEGWGLTLKKRNCLAIYVRAIRFHISSPDPQNQVISPFASPPRHTLLVLWRNKSPRISASRVRKAQYMLE